MSPTQTDIAVLEARLDNLAQRDAEMRLDMRQLTSAVSNLANSVAVLSEQVRSLATAERARPATPAPPVPVTAAVGAGGVGLGALLLELGRRLFGT